MLVRRWSFHRWMVLKFSRYGLTLPGNLTGEWLSQWIGLRENLQETIDFPSKYWVFL